MLKSALKNIDVGEWVTLYLDSRRNLEDYPLVNYSRTGEQTYFDQNGILQTAPANTLPAGYEYNSATGLWEKKGWYIGEERKNLVLDSREFDSLNWDSVRPSLTKDQVGIDGASNTAYTLVANEPDDIFAQVFQDISIPDNDDVYCYSLFVKKSTGVCRIRFDLSGGTAVLGSADVDLSDGSVVSGNATVRDYNDWWRLIVTAQNNSTGNTTVRVRFYPDINTGNKSQVIDQSQIEQASFPSPPIITEGSQVTRGASLADITDLSWYNQDEGTFVVDFYSDVPQSDNVGLLRNSGSDNINAIYFNSGAIKTFNGVSGGLSIAGGSVPYQGVACVAYNSSGRALSWKGTVSEDSTDFIDSSQTLDGFSLGKSLAGSYLNGYLKSLKYYPKRLSNSQLQALTS